MKIIDNGKGYIYTTHSHEEQSLEYGSLLIRMGAILKNVNLEKYYKKEGPHIIFDTNTSFDLFMKFEVLEGAQKDSGVQGQRRSEIFFDEEASPQREIIMDVIEKELLAGEYTKGYEIISDKKISEEFEKILMGEPVDDALKQKLLDLGEITYKGVYRDGTVVKEIELSTLGQIISMEIENVVSRRNPDVIYRRCIQCGNIFVTCGHAGNQDKLCSYKYTSGLCKKKRQEELDENRDPYEVIDKKIFATMYRRKDKPGDERDLEELRSWKTEYLNSMAPYKHSEDIEAYKKKAKKTWKALLKRINSQ